MYEGMGYSVYRRVEGYYNGMGGGKDGEDAFGQSLTLANFVLPSMLIDLVSFV